MISRIDVVTQAGAASYQIGDIINGYTVSEIRLDIIYFTLTPSTNYCGFDKSGNMVFSIDTTCPCVVHYK